MHDLKMIIDSTDVVKKNLQRRNFPTAIVDSIKEQDILRKKSITSVEGRRAEIKNLSAQIGAAKKQGNDVQDLMNKVATLKKENEQAELDLEKLLAEINLKLSSIPNLIDETVPNGTSGDDNVTIKEWGKIPKFDFLPKDHVKLGEDLGLLDFERGAKVTGARFVFYRGALAKLERALINFMLDEHAHYGYEEFVSPLIVNAETMYGTGQLPKFEEDLFKLKGDERNWYLIPTSEVPLTNFRRDELFNKDELPMKMTAYTPCFRSEAGSHGKDTRGLIRLHQFNKVELVNIVAADQSVKAHEDMINRASSILQKLSLPYRAMLLCAGDMGFSSGKTVDLEVWLPGQNKYREISSISNCFDFQARRAQIRYRDESGKPQYAHTLNGSGLAVGRTVVAIMENYQQKDGSIVVPSVLREYMGGIEVIKQN